MCARGVEIMIKLLREEEVRQITTVDFEAYGRPLEKVMAFKYLGRILMASDNNWLEVVANLQCARKHWGWLYWILGWEGADHQTSGTFYKAVVDVTLLFSVETWAMAPSIGKTLGGFHP